MTSTYILSSTALLRDGVQRMLGKTQFRVLGAAKRLEDLKITSRRGHPALFILFVNGPQHEAEEDITQIRHNLADARIVLLSPACRAVDAMSAFRLGASGYLADNISTDALLKSLEVVMADGIVLPREILWDLAGLSAPAVVSIDEKSNGATIEMASTAVLLPAPALPSRTSEVPALSERENVILRSLIKGDSNKHIARELTIAEATVKVHVKAILRKVRVRNRTQAAIWAIRNGEDPLPRPLSHPAPDLMNGAELLEVAEA